jgi:transcriptional regulator with XRE-family HTH domain
MKDDEKRARQQLGENLRVERVTRRITQEDLAHAAGIHRTQISLLESGDRVPLVVTFVKLCGALELSPNELLKGIRWDSGNRPNGCFVVEGTLSKEPPRRHSRRSPEGGSPP